MRRKKPTSWDGTSRMCTSPYPVKKGECLGDIDFGQGVIYALKGQDPQRYCSYCHSRMYQEEDEKREATQKETLGVPPSV